ncbi:TniB family NTP-binding protein [Litoreibacter arenae]|uniref:Transposition protein, putative n=1 Tax=Litoreibacter arenae DSM 19593 TaxID=1123360 RepID=S9RSA2_9RHOB|nr:TniB family NTP-binding protein [Litoreibacter arenae]EPX80950.1 transposition protein, putative [Litoreibacter arenae DSM 19593]
MTYENQKFAVQDAVRALRDIYVEGDRDTVFREQLDRLIEFSQVPGEAGKPVIFTRTGETRGIILVDGAGGGKTSLIDKALRNHPALETSSSALRPWIGVSVPSPATLKSLGRAILSQTGYAAVSDRKPVWDIWALVRNRLKVLGTVVLWIDEAHDLFHSDARHEVNKTLRMLKALMQGEGAVIVVLSGIEALWDIASFDDQVRRRYAKLELPKVTLASHGDDLTSIVEGYCDRVGLRLQETEDLLPRLIYASRGRFGRCIEFTVHAIEVALSRGHEVLTRDHFAEAWVMQEGCAPGNNVFLAPKWSQINLTVRNHAA